MSAVPNSSGFDLEALAQSVLETTEATEMADIAAEVATRVPVEHLRSALAQSLTPWIRDLNRTTVHDIRQAATQGESDDRDLEARRPRSSRWESASSIVTAWRMSFVGIPGSGQKRRCEITLAEQKAIAAFRRDQAASVLKEAQREHLFAAAMEQAGAETLGDLSEITVLEILRWEPEK